MTIPADLKYTKEHEWVRIEGDIATVGITDHAQEALGDIVFVETPEIGRVVDAGEAYAVVESVKAVSDVFAPVAGEVIEINEALEGQPELINTDPYGAGWIAKVKMSGATSELLSDDEYTLFTEE
ncbi:MAG: glycine cleavage system protein H [Zetaproteobacteria bacterium CG_4_9_14_3_um_filter_49_83]|nr:MAG: glycine cleavage system protein H [Zetaproteobacteria bacterium CG1_02_49_23]PIQ33804.1 MAG: glycine cleavage system protein H [Zetaproteobacteria bacterium CG17_big_fil_post_rev_8_21_14_2_50_50_13]PIV31634.1 MAG: glycine cleavage system protein H [Zetaproteobacteria bacterium CG02_land_8_20_14_3_00_50_9]PIY55749.1 MAG: glycine cleavage system protein H [Zetaproteobacteria bacterium CG_4_10_14_0_8_um_filter_49_80]PJA35070.1 MAG: glycine cleavage system protein H [Zetaproteobacteria bact